jgi:hypothetical protein
MLAYKTVNKTSKEGGNMKAVTIFKIHAIKAG